MGRSIVEIFTEVVDYRKGNAIRHNLEDILTIGLLSAICNGNTFTDMELFGEMHEEALRGFLELPQGIPSHDTFEAVFGKLDPKELAKLFGIWVTEMRDKLKSAGIAIDGKTIRRSPGGDRKAVHVVTAFASELQLVLGQLATDEKSNEITAIPKLLEMFCVKGKIITIDANGCADRHRKGDQGTKRRLHSCAEREPANADGGCAPVSGQRNLLPKQGGTS